MGRPTPTMFAVRNARARAEEIDRLESVEIECRRSRERLEREWLDHVARETCRFGRPVPDDPDVLDILAQVEVTDGDVWRWQGMRNNKGLATVRRLAGERRPVELSVVRVLAIAFGVISPDWPGMLYPQGSPDDVNPFHRNLRGIDRRFGTFGPRKPGRGVCTECGEPHQARGLCKTHYQRWYRAHRSSLNGDAA